MVWPPDSPWAPWWRTSKKTARAMCKLANINKSDVVYDLGSGEGVALLVAEKEFNATGVGIEIDPLRYFYSKIFLKLNNSTRVKIIKGNIFNESLSNATVVFIYLVPKTIEKLIPKFKKELKKGTRIVSYVYEVGLPIKKFDQKNQLRLYII